MKVSVALCTYNGENYLNEQIDSILNQTRKVDEIVVCDDSSTDSTFEILEVYAKSHPDVFKVVKNGTTLRSVKNFEKAISLCTGDVIFLSDQDDSWVPEKVADIIGFFEANPTINVVATNGYCMDENSEIIDKFTVWDIPKLFQDNNAYFDYYKIISCFFNIATGATMALRKSYVNECIPFPEIRNFHHDEWIARISSSKNQFAFLHDKYIKYRIHAAQQVGGVLYKINDSEKKEIIEIYQLNNFQVSFFAYKKRIKRLCNAYKMNQQLSKNVDVNQLFKSELENIRNIIEINKHQMQKIYPIKSFFLRITDKILNKRQINNIN